MLSKFMHEKLEYRDLNLSDPPSFSLPSTLSFSSVLENKGCNV